MAQATHEPAEVVPEVEDFAIKSERLCDVVIRDEPATPEMESILHCSMHQILQANMPSLTASHSPSPIYAI